MALYGRTYTLPMYDSVVIEAESQEEADKLFDQLENKWRYLYNIASNILGYSEARDRCRDIEFTDSFDPEWYGFEEPTYDSDDIAYILKED